MGHKGVDFQVICSWLGIAPDRWPPDHYTLLGLRAGEADADRIEEQVERRMQRVRCFQLTHPESATEAMNRIAQAFCCLNDAHAKQVYDRRFLGPAVARDSPPAQPPPAAPARPAVRPVAPPGRKETNGTPDEGEAWLAETLKAHRSAAPLPAAYLRTLLDTASPEAEKEERTDPDLPAVPESYPPPPDSEAIKPESERGAEEGAAAQTSEVSKDFGSLGGSLGAEEIPPAEGGPDPVLEAAEQSQQARRGLGTKRALYHRIARTRALLKAWENAGKYFNQPTRRLARPAEARELIDLLHSIRRQLANFPPLLGEAGQPGYLVVSLARQQVIVPTFQTLLGSQREALARDWSAGLKLLKAHQDFLRHEIAALRRKSVAGRTLRAARAYLNEHPGGLLLALALLALGIALVRQFM